MKANKDSNVKTSNGKNQREKNLFHACAEHIAHPDVELCNDYSLNLRKIDARTEDNQQKNVDLKRYWLPPNSLYPQPQPLFSIEAFAGTIALAVDKQLRRSGDAKSRNPRVIATISTLAKFFEFIWLRDRFNLTAAIPEDFEDLALALARGGWHEALHVSARLNDALTLGGHELASKLLSHERNRLEGIRENSLGRHIGTNIAAREAACYLKQILLHYQGPLNNSARMILSKSDVSIQGMGYSMLRQTLEAINLLIDLPLPYGIKFLPYPNPAGLAKKLTRPPGVTHNLGAVEAGALLSEGYKWLYNYGKDIASLVKGLCAEVRKAGEDGRDVLGYSLEQWLESSRVRIELEAKINIKIDGLDIAKPGCYSIRELMLILMSACFVLVATMNGRRRDEIAHRKFGLHQGFTEVVDAELEIYRGHFYIEKTVRDYDVFYVNKTTREAALLLESIQQSFDDLNAFLGRSTFATMPKTERSLFGYHRFSRIEGVNQTRNWYIFESSRDGAAALFLQFALGEDYEIGPHPHMFRRLYALVFMYQHEIPSLQALSQQLAHDSLGTTQIYINDPIIRAESERIRAKLDVSGKDRAKRFASHVLAIQKEVTLVSDEMMVEKMLSIIGEEPTSGGYPNFIKRFYRKLSSNLDFSRLTMKEKAERLAYAAKQRGHFPAPNRNGICMVGKQPRAPSSKCRSKDGMPQRELASASTCGKCVFNFHNAAYLQNLEEDLAGEKKRLFDPLLNEFEREKVKISIRNLEEIIHYHRMRLDSDGVQE